MSHTPAQLPAVTALFDQKSFTLIAGPCVIESYELCISVARTVKTMCDTLGVPYIFKSSFDKANRTSISSYRGPGMREGLDILKAVRAETNIPVLTDVHLPEQVGPVAEVVDVLQIPAFLCRQTDLIAECAQSNTPTNIKKGQFLSPHEMSHAANKFYEGGGIQLALTERGTTFGYNNLVVDMRALEHMRTRNPNAAIVFDATHSVQEPGGANGITGGNRELAPVLARAAAAVGIHGLFCEVHPTPDQARSDAANCLSFDLLHQTLRDIIAIQNALQQTRSATRAA